MIEFTEAMLPLRPKAAELSAQWFPVYLDPMPGSGERITIAVAAWHAGEHVVVRTLSPQVARCMYGSDSAAVLGVVDLVCDSLRAHLESGADAAHWLPPIRDAVFLGTLSTGYADTLAQVADAARALTSSLRDPALELANAPAIDADDDAGDEWERQIREETVRQRATFAPRFLQKVALREGAPPTRFGYLGDRLAAQFGRLLPGRGLTNHRNRAKAYITDLQILRDRERADILARPYYELMLWLPPDDSPAYSATQRDEARGAFVELETFGDAHDLRVAALADSRAAVQRILRAETAN